MQSRIFCVLKMRSRRAAILFAEGLEEFDNTVQKHQKATILLFSDYTVFDKMANITNK